MRLYKDVSTQKKVWSELAQYIAGTFIQLKQYRTFALSYQHYGWEIVMYNEEYLPIEESKQSIIDYTHFKTHYIPKQNFHIEMNPEQIQSL